MFPSETPSLNLSILPTNRVYFLIEGDSLSDDPSYTLTSDTSYLPSWSSSNTAVHVNKIIQTISYHIVNNQINTHSKVYKKQYLFQECQFGIREPSPFSKDISYDLRAKYTLLYIYLSIRLWYIVLIKEPYSDTISDFKHCFHMESKVWSKSIYPKIESNIFEKEIVYQLIHVILLLVIRYIYHLGRHQTYHFRPIE